MIIGSLPTPNSDELMAIKAILDEGLANVDSFNKVYVAVLSGGVALVSLIVGALVQLAVMNRQLKAQREIASDQQATAARQLDEQRQISEKQHEASSRQLDIQLSASRRLTHDNIAAKRQDWINGLRSDLAACLAMWQDIAYRWHSLVDSAFEERERRLRVTTTSASVTDTLPEFSKQVAELRLRAHENVLRIRMRLNPNEVNHNRLVELIQDLEDTVKKFDRKKSMESTSVIQTRVRTIIELIVSQAQTILKDEWKRVKGEQGIAGDVTSEHVT